jgi:translation initiation factor IF-2
MRRRSANAADIAILIVAADDGVKPQTKEALKAILEAEVPYIVCFTKIDKDTANLDRAKESVVREGVYLEGMGGDIPFVAVSGKSGAGVPELLDLIVLLTDVNSITCDPDADATAIVIESARDPRAGVSATMILKTGTVAVGTYAITGTAFAPVRAVENFESKRVDTLTCGKPMRISGFTEEPKVGSVVRFVKTKKEAEEVTDAARRPIENTIAEQHGGGEKPLMRLVLKADNVGSLEALEFEVLKLKNEKVDYLIVQKTTGPITEADVKLIIGFSPALILGFNTKVEAGAKDLAERQHIQIETRTIIYELSEWLNEETKKHEPEVVPDGITSRTKILKEFSVSGAKHVIGGRVEEGTLKRGDFVTIIRRGIEVGTGKVLNLQEQRSDAASVTAVSECGMQVDSKADIVAGDMLEASARVAKHG